MNPDAVAKANADSNLPRRCYACKSPCQPPQHFGEHSCANCGTILYVTSDGCCWPCTGMGGQSAAGHEAFLQRPTPVKPAWYKDGYFKLTVPGPRQLWISYNFEGKYSSGITVGITQMDVFEDGRGTWHPLHAAWRYRSKPTFKFRLRLKRPDDAWGGRYAGVKALRMEVIETSD